MTRQRKTPAQRAQEALGIAERAVARLSDKRADLRAELATVEAERDAAVVRRDYLKQHPDLGTTSTPSTTPTTPTGDK